MKLLTPSRRITMRILGLLMLALVMLLGWAPCVLAASTTCTSAGGAISLPPVTVPQNPAVDSLLGTPVSTTVTFTCSNLPFSEPTRPNYYSDTATIQAGNLAPADATDKPGEGKGIRFATNLPGIALQLTASPVQADDGTWLRSGPGGTRGFEPGTVTADPTYWKCIAIHGNHGSCKTYGGTYTGSVSETFTAQLIVTGVVTTGTLSTIKLMQFNWYIYGIGPSQGYFADLTLNSTTVSPAACSVLQPTTLVKLPTVSASAFTGPGSTPGQTRFDVQLNCRPGAKLAITLTANPLVDPVSKTSIPGGIANSGSAGNVGVQILDGSNPVTFGTPIQEDLTPSGVMNLPFYARYYQTAAGVVTGGNVAATATYTLTYP